MDLEAAHGSTSVIVVPESIDREHEQIIRAFLLVFGTDRPSIKQIWGALDLVWDAMAIDRFSPDPDKLARYYAHPVWVLNGLFAEFDGESVLHRERFADWIVQRRPRRVADFGGGFGTLARMVARKAPDCQVSVIEPQPLAAARDAAAGFTNILFETAPMGSYDIIVATDVFEHVLDPLGLLHSIAAHIPIGGYLLVANHFEPTIKCHLPTNFHLKLGWPIFMARLGFRREGDVVYGEAYIKVDDRSPTTAQSSWQRASQLVWKVARRNRYLSFAVGKLMRALARVLVLQTRRRKVNTETNLGSRDVA